MRYLDHVNSYLTKPDPMDLNRDLLSVHPSSASVRYLDETGTEVTAGKCLRQEWYKRRDIKKAQDTGQILAVLYEDPLNVWRMREGNAAEAAEIEILTKMGLVVHTQFAGTVPDLNMRFKVDAVVVDPDTARPGHRGNQVGVEIKSTHGWSAGKVLPQLAPNYRPARPDHKHVLQTGIYDWYFRTKKPAGTDVSYFLLVYRDRGTGLATQYMVVYDTESDRISVDGVLTPFHMSDVFGRFKQLQNHVKAGTTPDRDYEIQYSYERATELAAIPGKMTKTQATAILKKQEIAGVGDIECKYCPWAGECWNLGVSGSVTKSPVVVEDF